MTSFLCFNIINKWVLRVFDEPLSIVSKFGFKARKWKDVINAGFCFCYTLRQSINHNLKPYRMFLNYGYPLW